MHYEYESFRELAAHKREGVDFAVTVLETNRDRSVVVLAPHGGGIEPYTAELALEIAGDDLALYVFSGMSQSNNRVLHIASTRFDEPRAIHLVQQARIALALHGARGDDCFAMLGGRNERLIERLEEGLLSVDVELQTPPSRLAGRNSSNICNRCQEAGAQIELSRGLRERLRGNVQTRERFTRKVREALSRY